MKTSPQSLVALVRCESYDESVVTAALRRGLDLLGGTACFVKDGETILLKPNLLVGDAPERGSTTHPSVFRGAITVLREAGAVLSYGDSPGVGSTQWAAKAAGLAAVAEELRVPVADFSTPVETNFPDGLQNKQFTLAAGVLAADGIVSLPKFKAHGFQRLTGAIKNQFGCIPGLRKGEFHVRVPDPEAFAGMLVDLNRLLKPRLFIMDAVMAMEGNGPRNGTPRKLGLLILSADPVALDATMCRIAAVDPRLLPVCTLGQASGYGVMDAENISLVGDPPAEFVCPDFVVSREPLRHTSRKGMLKLLSNLIVSRPVILGEKCVRCGICVQNCPVDPKALSWRGGDRTQAPVYAYDRCIRCYCCQELCPEGAVIVQRPLLRRMFDRQGTAAPGQGANR